MSDNIKWIFVSIDMRQKSLLSDKDIDPLPTTEPFKYENGIRGNTSLHCNNAFYTDATDKQLLPFSLSFLSDAIHEST